MPDLRWEIRNNVVNYAYKLHGADGGFDWDAAEQLVDAIMGKVFAKGRDAGGPTNPAVEDAHRRGTPRPSIHGRPHASRT